MITLKRGQTADMTFALFNAAGGAFDATGFVVTFVANGNGKHFERTGVMPSPSSGTGTFSFVAADYATLKVGRYDVEVWATKAGVRTPMLSEVLVVDDVPQVL